MNCPRCNSEVNMFMNRCSRCGHSIKVYKEVVRISSSFYNLGLEKARIRDLSGAAECLKKSLKYNKYNTDARNLLGLIYYEMGETVEGLTQWILSKNIQSEGNQADNYIKIIQDDPKALELNDQIIKKYNSALLSAKQGNKDIAIVQVRKVVNSNPKFVRAQQLLALLYMMSGENKKALEHLKAAKQVDINNTITLKYVKEICAKDKTLTFDTPVTGSELPGENRKIFRGDSNIAVKAVGSYKKEKPRAFPFVNVLIGVIIGLSVGLFLITPTLSGKFTKKEAVKVNDYGSSLAEKDSKINSLENETKNLQEQIDNLNTELEAAKKDKTLPQAKVYQKILEAYKKYNDNEISAALSLLIDLDTSLVKNKTAQEIVKMINSQDVKVASADVFEKGRVAYNSGRYEEAAEYLQEALDLNPDNYDALYFFGRLYHRQGNKEKAVEYYKRVINNYADSPRAVEAKARLAELGVSAE